MKLGSQIGTYIDCCKYSKYRMRHFDETFLWGIFMRHFDETFWQDLLIAFENFWWHVMTFDMVMFLMWWPYDSFDCPLYCLNYYLTWDILYLYCDERRDIQWNIAWAQGKSRGGSLRDFPRAQAIFHCISQLESKYRHSQLQLLHWPSWEINIGRVASPYYSDSWAIQENIAQ